jgi:uncharacterized protein YgfB (UPF0149 family)
VLAQAGWRDEPAQFHGVLCGALCRARATDIDPASLIEDADTAPAAEVQGRLLRMRDDAIDALGDVEFGFTLLLPDDDAALAQRVKALAAWCDGFLYGLAGREKFDLRACSEEVREVVKDLTQFTQAAFDEGDDADVEENAYAELVEYIRVGAQLVYLELHPRPANSEEDAPYSKTIH